jgi:BirA family biotin operon repressor/biotin-[acetyl-CoA-carboxylase] ligase
MIGSIIERIHMVDSTNNYAANQLLTKRLPEGIIFVADSQIDGRGQVFNRWESEPNKNLTFSLVVYPGFLEISRQFELSKAISLGVTDYLRQSVEQVSVKWPNDIYLGSGKVAGILIENSISGRSISSSIIGIGININQMVFNSDAPNPVSLGQLTGQVYHLEAVLSLLCEMLDARYQQLCRGEFRLIDEAYVERLYRRDCWSPYCDATGDFEGRLLGVDKIGQLLIETRSAKIRKYQFKEVIFK